MKLDGHTNYVYSVAFNPNGKLIASGSRDYTVRIWNVQDGKEIYKLTGHRSYVFCVAFSPNRKFIASGSDDKTILIWNLADGKKV